MISDINTSVGAERNGQPVLVTSLSVAILFCKVILPFSANFRVKIKFRSLWQIPLLGSKFRDPRKTVGSTDYRNET
jgi:hypothetical protein